MINCLIIDDEPLARQIIADHLAHFPGWRISKECINAAEAWQALHETDIQVIFLDIQMPGISGVDFLRSLKNPPLVVFTTAYTHYAVDGFELMATDYLVKPITFERFKQAVTRIQERLSMPVLQVTEKTVMTEPAALSSDHIFVKIDSKLMRINFNELLFAEAQRDFSKIYLTEKNVLASFHLKMLEEMLPSKIFMRVHRSFLVNLTRISSIEGNMIYIQKHSIPIGSNYKELLLKYIGL